MAFIPDKPETQPQTPTIPAGKFVPESDNQYDMEEYAAPSTMDVATARAQSFARGLKDPITGGAQLLTKALPSSVVEAGNKLNNWLAEYGLVSKLPEGGLEQAIQEEETALQEQRSKAGLTGTDWSRVAGAIASPANLAIAARTPQAASTLGKIAAGAGQGTLAGALTPVTEGDFVSEKAKQIALGTGFGAATPAITGQAARMIQPQTRPEVKELLKAGVPLTPGQILGGAYRGAEERIAGLPMVGDIIKAAELRGIKQFNRATIDDALAPIGEKLPQKLEAGRDAIVYAAEKIGNKYDTLLPKLKGEIDKQFTKELAAIRHLGQNLPEREATQLNRIIESEVVGRFTKSGLATGRTLKNVESKLGEISTQMRRSDNYDTRTLGDAIQEVQASMRRMMERANPEYKGDLKAINKAYAKFQRPEAAAGRIGAKEGIFTPAQLRSVTRSMDVSKRKKAFARGRAPGQKFAETAESVLAKTVPESGTVGRALMAELALGGAAKLASPLFALGAGVGGLYTAPGQRLAEAALTKRPEAARALAEAVRSGTPEATAAAVPLAEYFAR